MDTQNHYQSEMSGKEIITKSFKTAIPKIKTEKLPNLKISQAATEAVAKCALEFTKLFIDAAARITDEHKKTQMNGDYVLEALNFIGYSRYADRMRVVQDEITKKQNERRQKIKESKCNGLTDEEAIALQQKLYNEAIAASK